ncbi:phage tail protein [Pseudomonas protegens]|uniref:Tail fiber protein n=1 Tax=Pseudomonas sp. W17 TaxID=3144407 RepID=A0AAU7WNI3_9PSED|nr:tail fiber protein [Pseudomonas protegens]BAO63017.1 phage tail collar domain-containing protein [Pseudomonas protegens Cab57]
MDPFIGEIRLFPWGWAPQGWLPCEGQVLPINSNVALASLLGKTYGGDGTTTFGLPDLRGRVALGQNYKVSTVDPIMDVHALGTKGGSETVTMPQSSVAQHNHATHVSNDPGNDGPYGNIPAVSSNSKGVAAKPTYTAATGTLTSLNSATVTPTQGAAMPNIQPSIVGYFCIATTGVYPPRQ